MRVLVFVFLLLQSCGNDIPPTSQKQEIQEQEVPERENKKVLYDTMYVFDSLGNHTFYVDSIEIDINETQTELLFEEIEEEEFEKYFSIKKESVDTVETMVTRTDTSFLIQIENEHIAFKANPKDDSEFSYYIGWLRDIDYHIISTNYNGGAHYVESYLVNGITGEENPLNADSDFGFNRFEVSPNQKLLFLSIDDLYSDDSYILLKKIKQNGGIYSLSELTNYKAENWMIQKTAWVNNESFVLKVIFNGKNLNSEEENAKDEIGFLKARFKEK